SLLYSLSLHDALPIFAFLQYGLARFPVQAVTMPNQLVDEAHALGCARLDHPPGEHGLHRLDRPRLADRAAGATEAREDTEIDLRSEEHTSELQSPDHL